MFAFLRQILEERRQYLQFETKPVETAKNMNMSKKFLEILQLSFEIRYLSEEKKEKHSKKKKIKAIEDRLNTLYNNNNVSTKKFDDIVALAAAYYNIGLIYTSSSETAELNSAVICFSRCLQLLQEKQLNPKAILTSLGALNEINLVCDKLEKKKYTFTFLNTALELYLKYTMKEDFPDPILIAAAVNIKEEESNPRLLLDIFHHTTLQDLGIQYLANVKDKHQFVMYMHQILNIRLSKMIREGRQFQEKCVDWAATLFDLSKYFLANNRFFEARHYIATADYVIYRFYEDTLKMIKEENSEFISLHESYDFICSISARTWGSYGVSLLHFWMEEFLQTKEENLELAFSKLEIKSNQKLKLLIFSDLEKELENMTNQITNTRILNLTDAKSVFIQTLRHLEAAKEYFSADTDIESYAKIALKISDTYKYFAGFEQQRDRQLKLHKRRIECLEKASKKFHETIDVDTELQIYKRIWLEIVTSCSTIMDLLVDKAYNNESIIETEEIHRFAKLISENINLYLNSDLKK